MTRAKRIDISLSTFTPVGAAIKCARLAEEGGFGGVWVPEHFGEGRDSVVLLGAIAAATSRVALGTAVTNPFARHPFLIANAIATLDELSGGRTVLGIGTGNPQRMSQVLGLRPKGQLTAMREAVTKIRALWEERTEPGLGYGPERSGIPIMIAAMQERMLRLAGEIGDGVIFSKATSPELVARGLKHAWMGRKKASRTRARFEVAALITCVCRSDERRAEAEAKEQTIDWLVRPARGELLLDSMGVGASLLHSLRRTYSAKGHKEAARAIPSSVLDHLAVYGNAESCMVGIEKFRRAGVTIPIISSTLETQERTALAISRRSPSRNK